MVRRLPASFPDDPYRLLLFHTPDQIEVAAQSGIDLYLAGHTHGGQVRIPIYGAVITASVYYKKYEAGLYQVGNTTLYVSRGIGMEGDIAPRVRFLAPPEVVVIDLVPGANAKAPGENQGTP
jgi:predicted MPP superfamily phosphohydrolase